MYSAEHPRVWNQIENRIESGHYLYLLYESPTHISHWDGKTCEQLQVGKVGRYFGM